MPTANKKIVTAARRAHGANRTIGTNGTNGASRTNRNIGPNRANGTTGTKAAKTTVQAPSPARPTDSPMITTEDRRHPYTDVFWIASADLQEIQYLNAAFELVWGQPRAGFNSARWRASIVSVDRELASSTFARLGVQDEEVTVYYRIRRPDGTLRHIKDRGIIVRDAKGNPASITGVATDITPRIEIEQSLREAHEFTRQVIADAQEGVIVLDIDGRCVMWNTFMEQFTGYTMADAYGRQLQEIIPALEDVSFETLIRGALAGEIRVTPDLHYDPLEGGARRWCVLRLAPRHDAMGRITGVIGTIEDITARKHIEAELRASEARYRNLVERATDFIYETDPSGRFTYFNIRTAQRLFGYSEQEMRGMSSQDLVHPDFRATVTAVYHQQFEQQIRDTYQEFPALTKDGRILWLGQNVTLLVENGRVMRHIAVARDITERKRINERRRVSRVEMEDLQDWYVALQTAIALAHELNQPLNAVCSYNEAALRMLKDGNPYPQKLLHALTASVQQAERAGKVMRDLLEFLAKDHLSPVIEATDINALLRQVLAAMRTELRPGTITLVPHLGANLSPVLTNRLHIEKVLRNLLRNSIEAMQSHNNTHRDTHGTITVSTARQEESVLVTVHDSGPGFTAEQAAKILEPFYTSKEKGVGMGLPVSRALIEAHGGRLWAESGAGATFRFTLPFAQ
jgi:PAS domain S-box-containing protein